MGDIFEYPNDPLFDGPSARHIPAVIRKQSKGFDILEVLHLYLKGQDQMNGRPNVSTHGRAKNRRSMRMIVIIIIIIIGGGSSKLQPYLQDTEIW